MQKPTVLIVDDDVDDIEMLQEALQKVNGIFDTIPFYNGSEALKWLELADKKPDFIFLDLNMPPLNGFQSLSKLKEKDEWKDIPVIIYTTSKFKEDKERCLKAGAAHFITKPSNFNELVEILSQVVEKKSPIV